jgi:hypothetical protein
MPSWQLFYGGMKRGVELSFLAFVDPFFESCRRAGLGTALSGCGSCFQFQKYCQLFIRTHNETLSVIAMRISNPDRSPVGINR